MNIDKIYVINLEERKDRKQQIESELKKQNITNYQIFRAIKPDIDLLNDWNKNYLSSFQGKIGYRLGCLGCLLSHYHILKEALDNNFENILILEDDTMFIDDYSKLFEYLKEYMTMENNKINEIDMLYLSGSHFTKPIKLTNNIYKIIKTATTNSYIINRRTMKYIIDNLSSYCKEIDTFYMDEIQNRFNCLITIPHITHQRNGYSNIQNKNVSYKMKF